MHMASAVRGFEESIGGGRPLKWIVWPNNILAILVHNIFNGCLYTARTMTHVRGCGIPARLLGSWDPAARLPLIPTIAQAKTATSLMDRISWFIWAPAAFSLSLSGMDCGIRGARKLCSASGGNWGVVGRWLQGAANGPFPKSRGSTGGWLAGMGGPAFRRTTTRPSNVQETTASSSSAGPDCHLLPCWPDGWFGYFLWKTHPGGPARCFFWLYRQPLEGAPVTGEAGSMSIAVSGWLLASDSTEASEA